MQRLELEDIQRMIIYGLPNRPRTAYVMCRIREPEIARRWLGAQLAANRIAHAGSPRDSGVGISLGVAFTCKGLKVWGLPDAVLNTFIPEFRQGMAAPHRARVIGDLGENSSEFWRWGGSGSNTPEVHVIFAAYSDQGGNLGSWANPRAEGCASSGFEVVTEVSASYLDREPFGFVDGISQPYIEGSGRSLVDVAPRDRIPAGEFVLGYENAFGQLPASPWIPSKWDAANRLPRSGFSADADLGRNGSFLVIRELKQDVDAFQLLPLDLQARLVGRRQDGTPLVLSANGKSTRAPDQPTNDFTYFGEDAAGLRCPLGAHIRRANPRDALASETLGVSPELAIQRSKQHRILRRSRSFVRGEGTNQEKGLLFAAFNANIERQFEFIQQTWINNPKFSGPYDEVDPLIGARDRAYTKDFTVRTGPERERIEGLRNYVRVLGGGYFFMPGLRALTYLSELDSQGPAQYVDLSQSHRCVEPAP